MTRKPTRFEVPLPEQAVDQTAKLTGICLGGLNVSKTGLPDKKYTFP
jgi:hypothetical protein